jgi:hypothetical protein
VDVGCGKQQERNWVQSQELFKYTRQMKGETRTSEKKGARDAERALTLASLFAILQIRGLPRVKPSRTRTRKPAPACHERRVSKQYTNIELKEHADGILCVPQ